MKIKICHFVNIITGKSDGVYAHLKMIFKHLDQNKFEQYLVFQGNPEIENEVKKLGVKVFVIESLNKKISIQSFKKFYSFIKSEDIDIIHTHFLKPYAIGGTINILLRRKMIFNYNGLFIENLYNTRIEKVIYRIFHQLINLFNSVDISVVPSFGSKEILLSETKLFPEIRVYYNGYDAPVFEQPNIKLVNYFLNLKKTYIIIGMLARIEMQKRIDIALKIIAKILQVRHDIYFVIMGDGALEEEVKHLINSMNLQHHVNMLGYIPDAKLYIKYFDILLFTSDWEGFPLSIWDAMAAGVPVVSSEAGGINEILELEKCGIIYPKGDVDKGSKVILKLLSDKNRREQMGRNGQISVKDKYNKDKFADFFNCLYTELSKKKRII